MCYICMFMHSETDRTSRGLRSKPNKTRDCITDTPKKAHACHAYNYNTYNVPFIQYNIRAIYRHIMYVYIYNYIYVYTHIILYYLIIYIYNIYTYIMYMYTWFVLYIYISCDVGCVYLCICIYGILNSHTAIIFPACPSEQDASMKKVLQFLTSHAPELQPGDSARGIQGGSVSSHRSH